MTKQRTREIVDCIKSILELRELEILTEKQFWRAYKSGRRNFNRTHLLNVNLEDVDLRQISL